MRILPPQTQPPASPITRRHEPSPSRQWTLYRDCLRWDFGFTCPFCLLHEADLFGGAGGEGLGGMTTEHRIARSVDDSLAGDYSNCLLACRFCNRSRSNSPTRLGDRRLLDPTQDAWADHFVVSGDEIVPVEKSTDASYRVVGRRWRRPRSRSPLGAHCRARGAEDGPAALLRPQGQIRLR